MKATNQTFPVLSKMREKLVATLLLIVLCRGVSLDSLRIFGLDAVFCLSWIFVLGLIPFLVRELKILKSFRFFLLTYISGLVISSLVNDTGLQACLPYLNALSVVAPALWLLRNDVNSLNSVLRMSLVFHVLIGLWEVFSGRSLFFTTWKMVDASFVGSFQRAASTIADPNYLAFAIIALFLSILHLQASNSVSKFPLVLSLLTSLGVLITFSRAGLLAIGLFWVWRWVTSKKYLVRNILLILALLPSVLLASESVARRVPFYGELVARLSSLVTGDASTNSRALLQSFGFELATKNLVFGIGPGRFQQISQVLYDPSKPFNLQTQVLNSYLDALLAGGVVLFSAFFLVWLFALTQSRSLAPSSTGGLVGLIIMLFTLDTMQFVFAWVLMVVVYATNGRRDVAPH